MQILVCDDQDDMIDTWLESLEAVKPDGSTVNRVPDAKKQISGLVSRKRAIREGGDLPNEGLDLDDCDVLIVDYDLLYLGTDGSRTTGEGVARLAREYSTCGAIVVMNQFEGAQFDLGMRGHIGSYADVNIDADLLGMAALWRDPARAGEFAPTIWTPAPKIANAMSDFSNTIVKDFGQAILGLVGLGEEAATALSDDAFGFVSESAKTVDDLQKVTVADFCHQALDDDVASGLIKLKPEFAARFSAHRIAKWLDREALRPMSVLVDAFHLVERMPSVLNSDEINIADPSDWTRAAAQPTDLLRWELVKTFHNEAASSVLGRPVFNWFSMKDADQLEEAFENYLEGNNPRFRLAEDTSRFLPVESITPFRSDFHNFNDRRAIEYLEGISYGPLRRLSFGED